MGALIERHDTAVSARDQRGVRQACCLHVKRQQRRIARRPAQAGMQTIREFGGGPPVQVQCTLDRGFGLELEFLRLKQRIEGQQHGRLVQAIARAITNLVFLSVDGKICRLPAVSRLSSTKPSSRAESHVMS